MRFPTAGALRPSILVASLLAAFSVCTGAVRAQTAPTANPAPAAAEASAPYPGAHSYFNPVVGPNYQIHRGDVLNVQVFGDQSLSQTVNVLGDGSVEYPLVGQLKVSGLTPTQAASAVREALLKYVRHPIVTVSVVQQAESDVLVFGDVHTPGRYALRADARLTDAIAAAGGLGPTNGSFPDARVSDAGGKMHSVSLQRLLHDGDSALNLPVDNGAIVYVPGPATFQVEVAGAVDHPGNVELNEGDRLSVAIAKAGNSANAHADLNNVRLTQVGPNGASVQTKINMYSALEHGDLTADPVLHKGDLVYVPQSRNPGPSNGGGVLYLLGRLIGL